MHRRASLPARINVLGEHTDYAGGLALPFATHLRLTLNAFSLEEGYEGDHETAMRFFVQQSACKAHILKVRIAGVEPATRGWKPPMLPLHHIRSMYYSCRAASPL